MASDKNDIFEQLRRSAVALISLLIAVTSLSYNTWRNEKTEDNRNQRFAAFEILLKLGDLQNTVFHHYYEQDTLDKGNPRTGWTYVLTIRDLSRVLPEPMPTAADQLRAIWNKNWEGLNQKKTNLNAVMAGIEAMRNETVLLLDSLE